MEKLLSASEVSEILGVSILTIYDWTSRKTIPYIKVGKLVKFSETDLDAWLSARSVKPRTGMKPRKARKVLAKRKRILKKKISACVQDSEVNRMVTQAKSEVL